MACDSTTLVALAATGKYGGLSDHDLKLAVLYALCVQPGPGATAQQCVTGAYAEGYDALSDRDVMECILVVACMNVNSQVLVSGLATLSGGTATVSNTNVSATNPIMLTYYSLNGNQATVTYGTVIAGTSFVITSSNSGDTNLVAWAILEP